MVQSVTLGFMQSAIVGYIYIYINIYISPALSSLDL